MPRVSAAAFALGALAVLSIQSCGIGSDSDVEVDEQTPGSESGLPVGVSIDDLPPTQREALEDGEVTVAEYGTAFANFEQCIIDGGEQLYQVIRDPVSGYISFGTSDVRPTPQTPDTTTLTGKCYDEYFDWLEFVFQTTNGVFLAELDRQDTEEFNLNVRPCLESNGITVPRVVEPGSAEFADFYTQWLDLKNDAVC